MSIFSAIKNAINRLVDVDVISETVFKESDKLIPVKLKIANNDKKQDIIINEIHVLLESREDLPADNNRAPNIHNLYEEKIPINITLPVTGDPVIYDFVIDYSIANALKSLTDNNLPADNPLNAIVGIASKVEKYGGILTANKKYKYYIYVNIFSQDEKVGKTKKEIVLTKPGEIAFNKSSDLFNI